MTYDEIISLNNNTPNLFFIQNNSSINSHLKPEDIKEDHIMDYFDSTL